MLRSTLIACAVAAATAGQSLSDWRSVHSSARPSELNEVRALARDFPSSSYAQLRLLSAAEKAGDRPLVDSTLGHLAEMGHSIAPERLQSLTRFVAPERRAMLANLFLENGRTIEASSSLALVPIAWPQIEGVAWDERNSRLYASSTIGRALLVLDGGAWREVPGLDAGNIIGLAIDPHRRLLWLASAASWGPAESRQRLFRGLIAIDLDDHRQVRRVPMAMADRSPLDIAVAADGSVYASESSTGAIYRLRPGEEAATEFLAPGHLPSPQGLAVSPDQRRLYVADYRYGIAVIDLSSGGISQLAGTAAMMLNAGDGILAFRDGLILIQNDNSPRRIIRLDLDRPGMRVTGLSILEQNHSAWGEPTLGQITGDGLVYVADAQWDRFDSNGAPSGLAAPHPTGIRFLPIRALNEPSRPLSSPRRSGRRPESPRA